MAHTNTILSQLPAHTCYFYVTAVTHTEENGGSVLPSPWGEKLDEPWPLPAVWGREEVLMGSDDRLPHHAAFPVDGGPAASYCTANVRQTRR